MTLLRPALLAAALVAAGPAFAQGPMDMTVKARQGLMFNFAFNLGILGGMAKGAIPYESASAQAAADNLYALASVDQSRYWPEGSGNDKVENTLALPDIWAKPAEFKQHLDQLKLGAMNMKDSAGKDLDSLKMAMNSVGGACGGCHKAFRQPN